MLRNEKFKILIIDSNKDFNNELCEKLQEYRFEIVQCFDEQSCISFLEKTDINLVLLNIDFEKDISQKIFNLINNKTSAKVILLSGEDTIDKREEYFAKGILDYHLTYKKIDHIVDDIVDSINTLETNKEETILVIHNSKETCQTIYNMLIPRNYIILTAITAKDGLEMLKDYEISLLILDMEIDDIDGLAFLEGLRDMYLLNQFFVLAISNKDNSSLVRETLKSGAKDFLRKPFSNEEFLLKSDILVNSSRSRKTIISQKKQIENSLNGFKELLDSTIGAMFIFEKNVCVNCNYEAVKMLGYKYKDTLLNKNIFDIFTDVSPEHKEYLLDDKVDHYFEDTILSKDEKVYQVQVKERNILHENRIIKIIALMDVTDVKRHEKILSQQTKMASMGEMIGNIAHQWRQPLTAISIAAGGIKLNYEFDMEERDQTIIELDNIVENTKFLSSTIESFQNFLKVNKVTSKFSLQSTCQKTLSIINANLKSHSIRVIENYASETSIRGIENELIQVFLNIINNAADKLKTSTEKQAEKIIKISITEKEDKVIISIHDNGNGIPPEILSKIFEPYFTTKHQSQGTGLGLYMTHQIIEKMGGKITVKNDAFQIEEKEYFGANFSIAFSLNK